ncbi:cysteine hydrolase family protein [Microvirga sp. 2TAF3]|uniref:cysteine hydrolase family protein n=1 Tax=Microvirga sp. 2TAF3 TaxID=3233014 RepID=UPI003F9996A8
MIHRPRSLLEIAGASSIPSSLADSALMLIDHQREYLPSGGLPLAGVEVAVEEIKQLLALARSRAMPIFHVVHHGRPGAPLFDPESPTARIIEGLEPRKGEATIAKPLPNAFARTNLHEEIRATGRHELIIAGFATHMCVSSTVRAALELGYKTTVVASATAMRHLPSPLKDGEIVPAATVQQGTIAALADRFAVVVPCVEALLVETCPTR